MRSLPVASLSLRWVAAGLGLTLLASGCPGAETPTVTGSESSGSEQTTAPTTVGPIDPTTGGVVSTTTNQADTSTGPITASTTAATTGATATTTAATTDASSSDGTTGGSTDSGTTGPEPGTTDSGTTTGIDPSSTGMGMGSSSGGGFIPVFDIGPAIECDLWLQDCPAGNKCMPWDDGGGGGTWNATMCSPIDAMTVPTGDVCEVVGSGVSGIDNCELGAMCWDVDGVTLEGTCVEMCTGSPMAPVCGPPGTNCVIANGGLLILCLPGCDPIVQDCAAGEACYPVSGSYTCAPDASGADGMDGDTCEFINVCDPGLMCIDAASADGCPGMVGCCSPFCEISMGDTCPGPEECLPVYPMPPLGYEDVGVCALP